MEKNTSFTEGKIMQPLLLFAVPVLLALFLQAMYGAVDLLIVVSLHLLLMYLRYLPVHRS